VVSRHKTKAFAGLNSIFQDETKMALDLSMRL